LQVSLFLAVFSSILILSNQTPSSKSVMRSPFPHMVAQKVPGTPHGWNTQGRLCSLENPDKSIMIARDRHSVLQIGEDLLVSPMHSDSVDVYRDLQSVATLNRPFGILVTADRVGDRTLLGIARQGAGFDLVLLDSDGNTLQHRVLTGQSVTGIHDDGVLQSVVHDDRWVLWAPDYLQVFVYTSELELIESHDLDIPSDVWQMSTKPFDLLTISDRTARVEACRDILGTPFTSVPGGYFLEGDRLVTSYWVHRLRDCKRIADSAGTSRPFDASFATEVFAISLSDFAFNHRTLADQMLVGYHGEKNMAVRTLDWETEVWRIELSGRE